jgi:hypothetical protein
VADSAIAKSWRRQLVLSSAVTLILGVLGGDHLGLERCGRPSCRRGPAAGWRTGSCGEDGDGDLGRGHLGERAGGQQRDPLDRHEAGPRHAEGPPPQCRRDGLHVGRVGDELHGPAAAGDQPQETGHPQVVDQARDDERHAADRQQPREQPLPAGRRQAQDEPGAEQVARRHRGRQRAGHQGALAALPADRDREPLRRDAGGRAEQPPPEQQAQPRGARDQPGTGRRLLQQGGRRRVDRPRGGAAAHERHQEHSGQGEGGRVGQQRAPYAGGEHERAAGDEPDHLGQLVDDVAEGVRDDVPLALEDVGHQGAARALERRGEQADHGQQHEDRPQRQLCQRQRRDEGHAGDVADHHDAAAGVAVRQR